MNFFLPFLLHTLTGTTIYKNLCTNVRRMRKNDDDDEMRMRAYAVKSVLLCHVRLCYVMLSRYVMLSYVMSQLRSVCV